MEVTDITGTELTASTHSDNAIEMNTPGTDINASRVVPRKRTHDEMSKSGSESEDESDTEIVTKSQRFEAVSADKVYDLELPQEMADYVTKKFATYVPEKDLKDSIMNENPVPLNIHKPHVLDDFLKELMEEQNKSFQVNIDKMLERLQHKTVNIMDPLSRVWLSLDNAMNTKKRKVEITLEDLNVPVEQTIVLLGQAYNALTYQR